MKQWGFIGEDEKPKGKTLGPRRGLTCDSLGVWWIGYLIRSIKKNRKMAGFIVENLNNYHNILNLRCVFMLAPHMRL